MRYGFPRPADRNRRLPPPPLHFDAASLPDSLGRELAVHHIFISYSSKHRDLTRALAAAIDAQYGAGSVWWDHALEVGAITKSRSQCAPRRQDRRGHLDQEGRRIRLGEVGAGSRQPRRQAD